MKQSEPYSLARLRRGTLHFLGGKAMTAGLTFAAFVAIARLLSTEEYAAYAAIIALIELSLALATFGLDWVAARYVPDYRINASRELTNRFIWRLAGTQMGIYLIFGVGLYVFSADILAMFFISGSPEVLKIYAAYLFIEGNSRMFRDQMLGHLLLQGRAQLSLIVRNGLWAAGVMWLAGTHGSASLNEVAMIEVVAALAGALIALAGLFLALRSEQHANDANPAWSEPRWQEKFVLARSAYLSYLLSLSYGPQVLTLLLSRFTSADVVAAFGFARNLADQVKRFLPAELLLGLVRPALISRYTRSNDFAEFNRSTSIVFLISIVTLAPLLVLAIAYGEAAMHYLGKGKFPDSALYLVLLLLTLIPYSHRRMIEMVANTIDHPAICTQANAYLLALPLAIIALLTAGATAWSVLAISLTAEIMFSLIVVLKINRLGFNYRPPFASLLRIALGSTASLAIITLMPMQSTNLPELILSAALAIAITAITLSIAKPFDQESRVMIRSLVAKRSS